jgi:hypothetical protein
LAARPSWNPPWRYVPKWLKNPNMVKSLLLVMFVTVLLAVGGACLLCPEQLRKANLKLRGKWIRPMPSLMKPGLQIWNIRISGAIAILMGLFLGWALWTNR